MQKYNSKLFHKDVFFPQGVKEEVKALQENFNSYFFSEHFKEHLNNQDIEDRSHNYSISKFNKSLEEIIRACLDTIKTTPREAFEVEITDSHGYKNLTKYCIRIPYVKNQDLVVVIRPQRIRGRYTGNNMITTAWLNNTADNHRTLDESKYSRSL